MTKTGEYCLVKWWCYLKTTKELINAGTCHEMQERRNAGICHESYIRRGRLYNIQCDVAQLALHHISSTRVWGLLCKRLKPSLFCYQYICLIQPNSSTVKAGSLFIFSLQTDMEIEGKKSKLGQEWRIHFSPLTHQVSCFSQYALLISNIIDILPLFWQSVKYIHFPLGLIGCVACFAWEHPKLGKDSHTSVGRACRTIWLKPLQKPIWAWLKILPQKHTNLKQADSISF